VLSFEFVSRTASAAGADDNLYGLRNTEIRSVELTFWR
jgi:hypothetical protein